MNIYVGKFKLESFEDFRKFEEELSGMEDILDINGNQITVKNQRIIEGDDLKALSFDEMKNTCIKDPSI